MPDETSDLDQTNLAKSTIRRLGLPTEETLQAYRIWDSYFTPSHGHPGKDGSEGLLAEIERSIPAIKMGCFEKLCYFAHVGIGTTGDREVEALLRANREAIFKPLNRWPNRLYAMIQLNANDVRQSLDAINRWLRDGPMLGVYFVGSGPGAAACTHRNVDTLVQRVAELKGVIMQHTWYKTGGKQSDGESTPAELAEVARRYPEQKFICAHAGGEWERGLRAVRNVSNVLVETSGFDSTAGFIEMAVREIGSGRIIFGSHLPSRSLGTELAKVVGARIQERDKHRILGANYRALVDTALAAKA